MSHKTMNRLQIELVVINQLEKQGHHRRNIKAKTKLVKELNFSEEDFNIIIWKLGLMNNAHKNLPNYFETLTVEQLCDYFHEISKPDMNKEQDEIPSLFLYS